MAQDQVEVMEKLGYREFFAAGHDRGARTVAHGASRQTASTVRTERRAGHPLFARAAPSARHTR
jgi:hypothetical protein